MNGRGAHEDSKNGLGFFLSPPEAEKIEVYLNQPERRSCSCSSSFRYDSIISSSRGLRTKPKPFLESSFPPLQLIFYTIFRPIEKKPRFFVLF